MRVFLVRHGESMANIQQGMTQHHADHKIDLTRSGRNQARAAGKFLADYWGLEGLTWEDSRIWVSPYQRTRETGRLIKAQMTIGNIDLREHILLCEQQFGLFDGLTEEEQAEQYPKEYAYYKKCESQEGRFWARLPLGESRFDVATRVHQAFGTFHRDHDRHNIKNIIVVCHGVTLRAFVMNWLHLTPEWFNAEPNPKNCSIRLLEDNKDQGYIYGGEDS